MTQFLKQILTECAEVDLSTVTSPDKEVSERHHVVGTLSEDLQRLWGLLGNQRKVGEALLEEFTAFGVEHQDRTEKPEGFDALVERVLTVQQRHEDLSALFWASIRHEFPDIATKPTISLLADWQVAWEEPKPSPIIQVVSIPGGLAELLGAGVR